MKKQIFLSIIIISLLTACVKTKKQETWYDFNKTKLREVYSVKEEPPYHKHGDYKYFSKEGTLLKEYEYKNNKLSGTCIKYFENGEISMKTYYKNGEKSGEHIEYYNNGNVKHDFNFKDGLRHGECISYNEDGKIADEGEFKNDKPHGILIRYFDNGNIQYHSSYSNGMLDGLVKEYYKNGSINTISNYSKGEKDGEYVSFNENGDTVEFATYKYDIVEERCRDSNDKSGLNGLYKQFHPNGGIKTIRYYKNNDLHGRCFIYYNNGKIASDVNYINGKADGIVKSYYQNGNLDTEMVFIDGKENGKFSSYYKSGKLLSEGDFINGLIEGVKKGYYENGQKISEIQYKNGKRNGKRIMYSKSGEIIVEANFIEDAIQEKGRVSLSTNNNEKKSILDNFYATQSGMRTIPVNIVNSNHIINLSFERHFKALREDSIIVFIEVKSNSYCVLQPGNTIKFTNLKDVEFIFNYLKSPSQIDKSGRINTIGMNMFEFINLTEEGIKSIEIQCFNNSQSVTNERLMNNAFSLTKAKPYAKYSLSSDSQNRIKSLTNVIRL